MKLSVYLSEHKLTPSEFAARLDKPASTISRLLKGERAPGMVLLREISEATNGAVTPNDFLPDATPVEQVAQP